MKNWTIDSMHSEVQFKVKHLMISTVTGQFNEFNAEVKSNDETFDEADVKFSAKIDSLSTGSTDRDGHLKSEDFFDAANFPELKFESTSFKKLDDEKYQLLGNLTIKDQTKEVKLNADFGGTMVDFYNNEKAGFEISGSINRKDFGLTWNGVTEAGGVVVSDEVKLFMNIQLQKQ
ncbi:YceI family protein [Marinilongibacter aquaticus]|uniref:YceI family protein n=1 Tax=Marinilongibacter aquaticus TaxID=2975157 RepID=UPI0021BD564A|nr:YceI family protein [Marinilongibacter aquaticus]UBM57860.1 YceI family protein [Marinilongibacter aquaticus]